MTPISYHITSNRSKSGGGKKYLISRLLLGSLNIPTRQVGVGGADLTDGSHRFGGVGFRALHLVHQSVSAEQEPTKKTRLVKKEGNVPPTGL